VYASDDPVRRILSLAGPFAEHGSNSWALTRAQALVAISAIEHESRVVLWGEVWLACGGAFSPTAESWDFELD